MTNNFVYMDKIIIMYILKRQRKYNSKHITKTNTKMGRFIQFEDLFYSHNN